MGIDRGKLFFSPFHMQLVYDRDQLAGLDGMLDVMSRSQVEDHVLNKIKRFKPIVW